MRKETLYPMTVNIPFQRLFNQRISQPNFTRADEIVRWLGAVQAQDFAAAKWALGLRAQGLTDAAIEQAFDAGEIIRTHILRPTWHFIHPADLRWMLALTGPRVNAYNASYYRKFELDGEIFGRSNAALERALQGGKALTRPELESVLREAGVPTDDLRITMLVMRAELDGVLCSGPRQGKQFTYMLLEERVPPTPARSHEEALAELTLRYFTSHGPATIADFSWWSGLSMTEARKGVETAKAQLTGETLQGQTVWFDASAAAGEIVPPRVDLLPAYDEYTVAYVNRDSIAPNINLKGLDFRSEGILSYAMFVDGLFVGPWKRTLKGKDVLVELRPFAPLDEVVNVRAAETASRYGEFLGLKVALG